MTVTILFEGNTCVYNHHKGKPGGRTQPIVEIMSHVPVMEVQAPTEQNLFGDEAVRLGRDWPTEHDDTTHLKRGYYRRDDGSLGKVVDGVKLTDSEDDYSSSHSAKRAKMNYYASESDPSDVGSPKGEATNSEKDIENDDKKDDDKEKVDEEDDADNEDTCEEESALIFNVCRQTLGIDDDGNEAECGGETDGCSQMCHSCKQDMKRGWFAYGNMR